MTNRFKKDEEGNMKVRTVSLTPQIMRAIESDMMKTGVAYQKGTVRDPEIGLVEIFTKGVIGEKPTVLTADKKERTVEQFIVHNKHVFDRR